MQAKADEHRHDQVRVHPRRHLQQTSIFAKRVQRVEHLDRHENAQRQRARLRLAHGKVLAWRAERHATSTRGAVRKAGAESLPRLALTPRHQLLHRDGRVAVAAQVDAHEVRGRVPCRERAHRREADVHANNHVAEEHPRRDQAVVGTTRGLAHDVQVRRVESERRGGWAVGDQINPQQLHGNETLWESERGGDEDGSNLADVAADHVADESLHVVVDRSSLRHRGDDRVEVVVRKHHVARLLRHLRARDAHCHANVREFECGRVVHAVARHRRNLAVHLQRLHNLDLILRRCARKDVALEHNLVQFLVCHHVELRAGVNLVVLIVGDAECAADGKSRLRVISRNHFYRDASRRRLLNGVDALVTRWIENRHEPHHGERELSLILRHVTWFQVRDVVFGWNGRGTQG
mmetsp:Transcript_11360/g.25637  ORF Transcript_11360/g.25637 Transcript_11360/m.25637 type:complete len:407 (-) Transcript_11360:1767-2987(-)